MQTFLGQKKRLQRRCQQNICMLSCITIETSSTALSHSSSTLKGDKAQTETSVDKWWWRLSRGSAARLCSLSVPSANTFIHSKNNNKKQKAWFLRHSWSCFFPVYSDFMFFSCMFEWVDVLLFEPIKQDKCFLSSWHGATRQKSLHALAQSKRKKFGHRKHHHWLLRVKPPAFLTSFPPGANHLQHLLW